MSQPASRPWVDWPPKAGGLGALIALLVLVVCLVLSVINKSVTWEIGLIAALAVARLT